jgi:hypothetical protein
MREEAEPFVKRGAVKMGEHDREGLAGLASDSDSHACPFSQGGKYITKGPAAGFAFLGTPMLPEGGDRRELGVLAAARNRQLPSAAGACPVGQLALRTEGKPHFPVSKLTRGVKAKQHVVS